MVYKTKHRWNQGAPSITRFLSALLAISFRIRQGCSVSGDNFARTVAPANDPPKTSLQTQVNSRYNANDVVFNIDASSNKNARADVVAEQRDMIDFSFSHVAPSCLPAPAELDTNSDGDNTTVVRSSHSMALSLRECSLGDSGVSELASSPWVSGEMSVRALSLRQNQVRLVSVDSYSDEITASGARVLFEALRSSSADRLSYLQLDFNPLGNAGIQPLPAYLKQRAARGGGGLEELSLRFCGIGLAGCRYISSALAKSAASTAGNSNKDCSVEPHDRRIQLDETGNVWNRGGAKKGDKPKNSEEGADREFFPANHPACGIRKLLLAGNRLGDGGAKALASALEKDSSVEVLDLTRCHISDEGVRYLANALRSNTSLRELRLGYNEISADGASSLATLLRSDCGHLEILELQGNRIEDVGAVALARGLAGRRTKAPVAGHRQRGLRQLNLGGNRIGCVGGCALAKALRESGRKVVLEELELAGNPLTLRATRAAEASKNPSYLYKSAGGALSSLLNQFVDKSYYHSEEPSSPSESVGEREGRPLRCAVAAFGTSLRHEASSLKMLGLARTGVTEDDAFRLAAALRKRRVAESSLEKVQVGMNGLGDDAMEAVRLAVESPTSAYSDVDKSWGFAEGRESRQARGRSSGGRGSVRPPQSRMATSTRRDDNGHRVNDKVAVRGEVEKYAPVGGDVELELFGRKVASFRQARIARSRLDVQVFGKRVRFESMKTVASPRDYRKGVVAPRTGDAAVDEDGSDDSDWDDDDWGNDGDDSDVENSCYYDDVGRTDIDVDSEEDDDAGEEEAGDDEEGGIEGDNGEGENDRYFDLGHSNINNIPNAGRGYSNPWGEVEKDGQREDDDVVSGSRDSDEASRSFSRSRQRQRRRRRQAGLGRFSADEGAADRSAPGEVYDRLISGSARERSTNKRDAGIERAVQARKGRGFL